jgi:hypothetical protein
MGRLVRWLGKRIARSCRSAWGLGFMILLSMGEALAAGGPATKLVNVADTRGMDSGFSLWLAEVYNTNLWLFGLLVVVIMAGIGAILGFAFDKLVALLGIRLGKLDHHE